MADKPKDKVSATSKPSTDLAPDARVVTAFHRFDDVNVSAESHHHTIGTSRGQAADARHNHRDGNGHPLFDNTVDVISGSRSLATGAVPAIIDQICDLLEKLGASNATTP
ncbi:MAG TPA: hypothetical protein VIJ25_18860 [Methylococcales bacterium]